MGLSPKYTHDASSQKQENHKQFQDSQISAAKHSNTLTEQEAGPNAEQDTKQQALQPATNNTQVNDDDPISADLRELEEHQQRLKDLEQTKQ